MRGNRALFPPRRPSRRGIKEEPSAHPDTLAEAPAVTMRTWLALCGCLAAGLAPSVAGSAFRSTPPDERDERKPLSRLVVEREALRVPAERPGDGADLFVKQERDAK